MRIAILGAGGLATTSAHLLIEAGCDVVIVEKDADRVKSLADELDCGLIHGDGTKPAILREVEPERCDALLCLSGSDHDNLLASLVGRHLGFPRILTKIENREFEPICAELGLDETIIPDRTIARALVDMVHGHSVPEMAAALGGQVRLFSFVIEESLKPADLELPEHSRLLGVSRNEEFVFVNEADGKLEEGDQVLLLTDPANLEKLEERWGAANSNAKAKTNADAKAKAKE